MKNHIESKLCLGCWSFGGDKTTYWGPQSERDADEIVSYAIDKGYPFFDTAPAYNDGMSEVALGKSLSRFSRDKYALNTKLVLRDGVNIEQELLASLKRLGLDYVDVYMIHWPTETLEKDAKSLVEEFERLKEKGLLKNYGISNFGVQQLKWMLNEGFRPFINQLPYSLVSRAIEFEVMKVCQENQINIMAYMVLLQGILTGKYSTVEEIPLNRRRTRHFNYASNKDIRHREAGAEEELLAILKILQDCAKDYGVSPSLLATSWCLQHSSLQTVIVGVRTLEQLQAGIAAVEFEMPQELYTTLSEASDAMKQQLGAAIDLWESKESTRTF